MRYVIIGNSAAAVGAVEAIRTVDGSGSIVLIGEEPYHVYSRPLIAHYLAGETAEEAMAYRPEDFYSRHGVEALLGRRAAAVDPRSRHVTLEYGGRIPYDRLLIATGSKAAVPPIKGKELAGVTVFQKFEEARAIREWLGSTDRAVVIGGGLIGLRAVYGLQHAGAKVTIVELMPAILGRVLDRAAASLVERLLAEGGVSVLTGRSVAEITGSGGRVDGVILDDGRRVECGLVVIATGVRPNADLAVEAGIEVNQGIAVNEFFQTNYSDVYAAGDVAETFDIPRGRPCVNANWPNAHEQGRYAGLNMAGERRRYPGSLGMNSVSFFGVPVMSMGVFDPEAEEEGGYEVKLRANPARYIYQKLVFKDNRLKGAIFMGDLGYCGAVKELIKDQSLAGIIKDSILEEKYQLYGFLRKRLGKKLEGMSIPWKQSYTMPEPYRKSFDEARWTERERDRRAWRG